MKRAEKFKQGNGRQAKYDFASNGKQAKCIYESGGAPAGCLGPPKAGNKKPLASIVCILTLLKFHLATLKWSKILFSSP